MRELTIEAILGFLVVLTFVFGVGCIVAHSRIPRALKLLIHAALALRVAGACVRYAVIFGFYGGESDSRVYYWRGLEYADLFWQLDFSPLYNPALWHSGQFFETQFVRFASGIVLSVIGPSLLGEFLVFSLLAFLGLVGFAIAFRRAYPGIPLSRYARWIWLFPSLWFWPSSVGKEAILLMGLGLAVAGFVGRNQRANWLLMVLGTFFVFAIRPQVAAVLILSFILAQWLSLPRRWTVASAVQGLMILGAGLVGIWFAMQSIGVSGFDVEGVKDYMVSESARAAGGGSSVGNVGVSLSGVPFALVNILFRPFPWEARNIMALISALEIGALWVIAWFQRGNLVNALRRWRSDRFLRVAVPFILVYAITLGMLVANLGIIARQRIFLFPFVFLLLEAMPTARKPMRSRAPHIRPQVEPEVAA